MLSDVQLLVGFMLLKCPNPFKCWFSKYILINNVIFHVFIFIKIYLLSEIVQNSSLINTLSIHYISPSKLHILLFVFYMCNKAACVHVAKLAYFISKYLEVHDHDSNTFCLDINFNQPICYEY